MDRTQLPCPAGGSALTEQGEDPEMWECGTVMRCFRSSPHLPPPCARINHRGKHAIPASFDAPGMHAPAAVEVILGGAAVAVIRDTVAVPDTRFPFFCLLVLFDGVVYRPLGAPEFLLTLVVPRLLCEDLLAAAAGGLLDGVGAVCVSLR
jgi:hypothetical protein